MSVSSSFVAKLLLPFPCASCWRSHLGSVEGRVSVSEILSGDIRKSLLMSLQTEEAHIHTGKGGKKADRHAPQRKRERERQRVIQV